MWAQLCLENKTNVIFELNNIILNLQKYKQALESDNFDDLKFLFKEGKDIKHEIDG